MATAHVRKPDWLKIRLSGNDDFRRTKEIVESHGLHTICTSGKCPNQGECWSRGTATFMIGSIKTGPAFGQAFLNALCAASSNES